MRLGSCPVIPSSPEGKSELILKKTYFHCYVVEFYSRPSINRQIACKQYEVLVNKNWENWKTINRSLQSLSLSLFSFKYIIELLCDYHLCCMNTLIKQICKFNYSPLCPTNHLIDFHRKTLLPTVYELLKSSVPLSTTILDYDQN